MISRPFFIAFLAAFMITAAGCSSKDEPKAAPSESAAAEQSANEGEAAPLTSESIDDLGDSEDPMAKAFAELIEKLNEAMAAGIEAETGSNDCARAASGIKAMQAKLTEFNPSVAEEEFPEKGFLELCGKLSPEEQRCMRLSQQRDTPEVCQEVTNNIAPEIRAEIETLFGAEEEEEE